MLRRGNNKFDRVDNFPNLFVQCSSIDSRPCICLSLPVPWSFTDTLGLKSATRIFNYTRYASNLIFKNNVEFVINVSGSKKFMYLHESHRLRERTGYPPLVFNYRRTTVTYYLGKKFTLQFSRIRSQLKLLKKRALAQDRLDDNRVSIDTLPCRFHRNPVACKMFRTVELLRCNYRES